MVRPCSQLGVHAFKVADVNAKLGQNYAIAHWRLVCVAINMKYHTSNARRWSGLRLSWALYRDFVPKVYFEI